MSRPQDQSPDLAAKFHQAMIEIYTRAAEECDYRPVRFLQMVTERGGLATAKLLLSAARPAEGLSILWERRRLDLSVEAVVCSEGWRSLFTADELKVARKRLSDLGYHIP